MITTFAIPASPSPDAWRYLAHFKDMVTNQEWDDFVTDIASYTPTFEFVPGRAYQMKVKCEDRSANWSDYGGTLSWMAETQPPWPNLHNPSFELDDVGGNLLGWTLTNNNGTAVVDATTGADGTRSIKFQWTSGVTPPHASDRQ